jgi:hypothetical protein
MSVQHRPARRAVLATAATVFLCAGVALGCSDKTNEDLRSAGSQFLTDASGAANATGVRGAAESFRGLVKAKASGQELRSMTVVNEAASNIPSTVTVSGITDADGDGKDDDGFVQFTLDGRSACVVLPATGDNTEVTNDACSTT